MSQHSDLIPSYLTAQSLIGLRRLMFITNAKDGTQYRYFDIQQYDEAEKKKWVAWYYRTLKNLGELDADIGE
jgi:hypothetical protein